MVGWNVVVPSPVSSLHLLMKNLFPSFLCANVLMYIWILMSDIFIVFLFLLCVYMHIYPRGYYKNVRKHEIKTQWFDYGVHPMWVTALGPAQWWGGLLSLSGIKDIMYKQLYKNDPYTSSAYDDLKMESSTGERDITIGFLSCKCEKLTINLPNFDNITFNTQGIFSAPQGSLGSSFHPLPGSRFHPL